MTDQVKRAGQLQIGCLCVFCAASLVGVFAFINGNFKIAAVNAVLMAVTFWLYQVNSRIVTREALTSEDCAGE